VLVEAGVQRTLAVGGLPIAGERDQVDRVELASSADATGQLVPIHPGEADVHECDVGPHAPDGRGDRKLLYDGAPSWRAYFTHYFLGGLATLFVPALFYKVLGWVDAPRGTRVLVYLVLLGVAALYFFGLYLYRKSIKFRVTTSNIETERGMLSKKIDVLELWRCRDVRYKQNLLDRILGIAHIEIYTADVTTPHLEIVGLPASRQLFEQLRDGIELQRQARNVYGVVS